MPPGLLIWAPELLFRQHYWTHIEFYPMHLTLSVEVEDELVAILTHACIGQFSDLINLSLTISSLPKDYMTSSLSTVPYNQEQCEAYLRLIKGLPDSDRAEGYRNCVLARLWSEIDGNFFVNLRGEDNARLSRIQRLLPEPNVITTKLVDFLKWWLTLGLSGPYERILSEMWVDKISYASHWKKFMGSMMSEWKMHATWVRGVVLSGDSVLLTFLLCAFFFSFCFTDFRVTYVSIVLLLIMPTTISLKKSFRSSYFIPPHPCYRRSGQPCKARRLLTYSSASPSSNLPYR